ncbi:MAG: hypothetical protein AAGA23_03875, partial [Pseudomonadota bacterium]
MGKKLSLVGALLGLMLAGLWLFKGTDQQAETLRSGSRDLAINNVRFFDGERMHEPSSIWISDGRISEIGPMLADHTATNTIDGAGKTLLPGLIDAHV